MQPDTTKGQFFLGEAELAADGNLVERNARVFQTFMSDEELASRNIAVFPASQNRWVLGDVGAFSRNIPLMHAVNSHTKADFGIKSLGIINEIFLSKIDVISEIESRISELIEISKEEKIPISLESISRARSFFKNLNFNVTPSIFLAANGNLRIIWQSSRKEQVALQIKAEKDEAQYVIFRSNDEGGFDQILGLMALNKVYSFLRSIDMVYGLLLEPVEKWKNFSSHTNRLFAT